METAALQRPISYSKLPSRWFLTIIITRITTITITTELFWNSRIPKMAAFDVFYGGNPFPFFIYTNYSQDVSFSQYLDYSQHSDYSQPLEYSKYSKYLDYSFSQPSDYSQPPNIMINIYYYIIYNSQTISTSKLLPLS